MNCYNLSVRSGIYIKPALSIYLNATSVAFFVGIGNIMLLMAQNINNYTLDGGDDCGKRTVITKPK